MKDDPIPLTCNDHELLAKHSAGFDLERDCFVAIEELPPGVGLTRDTVSDVNGTYDRVRCGSVVCYGPVSPRDGVLRVSPILARLIGMEVA